MNVDMLHVNGGRECLQRGVIEPVQGGHKAQIVGDPLRQRLGQSMVVYGKADVVAQQIHRIQFGFEIRRIPRTPSQSDHAGEFAN